MTNKLNIRKKAEFKAFIKFIKQGADAHWIQVAEAIGVDKDTINRWKKLPEAQKAIQKGIDHAMKRMSVTGTRDWRMWRSKLKMLGISPVEKSDITSDGEKIVGPVIFKPENKNKNLCKKTSEKLK